MITKTPAETKDTKDVIDVTEARRRVEGAIYVSRNALDSKKASAVLK
jgi:hypothetical protein